MLRWSFASGIPEHPGRGKVACSLPQGCGSCTRHSRGRRPVGKLGPRRTHPPRGSATALPRVRASLAGRCRGGSLRSPRISLRGIGGPPPRHSWRAMLRRPQGPSGFADAAAALYFRRPPPAELGSGVGQVTLRRLGGRRRGGPGGDPALRGFSPPAAREGGTQAGTAQGAGTGGHRQPWGLRILCTHADAISGGGSVLH